MYPMLAASRHCGATPLAVTCNISPLHRNGATFPPVTFNLHPLAPLASPLPPPPPPLPPLPVRAQRRCTPPRCCPTFNVQRSTFTPSPLSPLASRLAPLAASPRAASPPAAAPAIAPAAGPGAAPLHPSTLLSHVQRATFNLHPLAPLASRLPPRPSRRIPARRIPSRRRPRHCPRCRSGRSAAAPLHVVVPRSTCNVQPSPPRPSRLSPLASRLAPLASYLTPLAPVMPSAHR
jgi:hypothetical protein